MTTGRINQVARDEGTPTTQTTGIHEEPPGKRRHANPRPAFDTRPTERDAPEKEPRTRPTERNSPEVQSNRRKQAAQALSPSATPTHPQEER